MTRVLQVVSSLQTGGGVQTMLKNYYSHIEPMSFKSDFVVCGKEIGGMESWFEKYGAHIYHISPRAKHPVKNLCALYRILKDGHYDVLHCHQDYHGAAAVAIAKHLGVPVRIIHSHQAFPPENTLKKIRRYFGRHIIMRDASVLAACGEAAGLWLYGKKTVESGCVEILRNAIDVDAFSFTQEGRNRLRNELGISEKVIAVGHVGRFAEQKNHSLLVNIFAEFHRQRPDSVLLLIGDGPLRPAVEAQVAKLGIRNAVFFLGIRTDVPQLLSSMDLFLLPSRFEGLGIVAVEAQVSGLPCICSHKVPQEVKITENLCFMPEFSYTDCVAWSCMMERKLATGRTDGATAAKMAGYDIYSEAKKLEMLYLNVCN